MSDDLINRGAQDRGRISLTEPHEVQYWTETLGVDFEEIKRVLEKAGNGAAAVRRELGSDVDTIESLRAGDCADVLRSVVCTEYA